MLTILPLEIIDQILGWLPKRRDLINFACASRACKGLAIPYHTEYRVLRVSGGLAWQRKLNPGCVDVWRHLAGRSGLTSNIRTIELVTKSSALSLGGFRLPTQLVEKEDKTLVWIETRLNPPEYLEHYDQSEDICAAVAHMDKLDTFIWRRTELSDQVAMSGADDLLFELLAHKPALRRLQLSDDHAIGAFLKSLTNPKHSLWRMSQLEELVLGYSWGFHLEYFEPHFFADKDFAPWIRSLTSLTFLKITEQVFLINSKNLPLPALKRFSLHGHRMSDSPLNPHITTFLQNHPLIEEFSWTPGPSCSPHIRLFPGCLPNLRRLSCPPEFILALEASHHLSAVSSAPRKLEELTVFSRSGSVTPIDHFIALQVIDHVSLKSLRLNSLAVWSLRSFFALPEAFPNLVSLSLPSYVAMQSGTSAASKTYCPSQDQWFQFLSKFRDLEVFNGEGIWGDAEFDHIPDASAPEVTEVVQRIAQWCPKLRQIMCPVVFDLADNVIEHRHQKVRIWREDARSLAESKVMVDWLRIEVDDVRAKNWIVRWDIGEPAKRDPFETMSWDETD